MRTSGELVVGGDILMETGSGRYGMATASTGDRREGPKAGRQQLGEGVTDTRPTQTHSLYSVCRA